MSATPTTPAAERSAALVTAGVDVGSSAVKVAIVTTEEDGSAQVLGLRSERIRRRELRKVIEESFAAALEQAGVTRGELAYIASTGEGELVDFRRGHFYGMTTHARGAKFLMPPARAVLDVGALHARAMLIDARSRVLVYRMTNQCASGSGQFLENVARYLGMALEDVGEMSCGAKNPQPVSSICAVLAETDVINMVSRGISTADILKGIHLSMAGRYIRLLRAIGAESPVAITGGLALDTGLAQALEEKARDEGAAIQVLTHPQSIFAGALGAALWGGFRHRVLAQCAQTPNEAQAAHSGGRSLDSSGEHVPSQILRADGGAVSGSGVKPGQCA
jgi:benzoyl-CoA reductase subunit D